MHCKEYTRPIYIIVITITLCYPAFTPTSQGKLQQLKRGMKNSLKRLKITEVKWVLKTRIWSVNYMICKPQWFIERRCQDSVSSMRQNTSFDRTSVPSQYLPNPLHLQVVIIFTAGKTVPIKKFIYVQEESNSQVSQFSKHNDLWDLFSFCITDAISFLNEMFTKRKNTGKYADSKSALSSQHEENTLYCTAWVG